MTQARVELLADSRQVRRATDDLKALEARGQATTSVIGGLARAFAVLGGAAAIRSATRTIADFSQQISTVAAISGATTSELALLREEILRLGSSTRFSASEAAAGAQFLARAGFDTNQILASLNDTLTLAQAGNLELGAAADIASNVLTGFRISADEAGRAVDVLAFAANRANTDVQQLGDALSFVAPIASGLGVSLEETTAAISALSDAGLQGSTAGTGLRRVLSTLESPTGAAAKRLGELGVSAEEVRVSNVGLTAALERLRDAGITTGEALEIFGDRGGPAFEVLSNAIPRVREMSRALGEAEGFAQGVADVMDDNLNGALLSVQSAVEGLIIGLGDLGAESSATKAANSLADSIRALTDNLDTVADIGTAVAAVFGARLASSAITSAGAFAAAQIQAVRYQATLASMAGVSRTTAVALTTMGAAARGASAAMAFLGGPVGVALLAAGAIAYFAMRTDEAIQPTQDLSAAVAELGTEYEKMTDAQRESAIITIKARQAEIEDEIARLEQLRDLQREVADFTPSERASLAVTLGISEEELQGAANAATATQAAIDGLAQRSAALDEKLKDIAESANKSAESIDAAGSASVNSSAAFASVAASLAQQIIELRDGADAAEDFAIAQRLGADATEAEKNAIQGMLVTLRELRAERERQRAREGVTTLVNTLSVGDDPAAQAEDQMFARLAIIDNALAAEAITKEEHRQAELLAEQAYQDELTRIDEKAEKQRTQLAMQEAKARRAATESMLAGLSGVFGNFAEIAKQGGEETFGAYKALASAQAAISAAVAINRALADGGPFLGPALAVSIAALTGAQIAAIHKQQYSPRALGGQVQSGGQYLVGERGPELITMGSNGHVTPYNQLMREARNSNQAPQQNVRVIVENYGSERATTSESVVDDERIIRVVVGNINARREVHSAITRTTTANNKVGA